MARKNKIIILIFFILLSYKGFGGIDVKCLNNYMSNAALLDSGLINGIKYKFILKGTYYSFSSSFTSKADINCIISISYDFDHKVKYNKVVKSMSLLQQGKNWYEVSYTYQKFYFIENTSKWIVAYFPDKNKVVFKMISNKSNFDIFDIILVSDGYFRFCPRKNGYQIEYFQECLLKSDLMAIPYVSEAKDDAINFIMDYKEYLEENCKK